MSYLLIYSYIPLSKEKNQNYLSGDYYTLCALLDFDKTNSVQDTVPALKSSESTRRDRQTNIFC